MFHWLTERRRKHLLETPFPEAWTQVLEADVAIYSLLDAEDQRRLRDLVQVFIAEKRFEGCGGLELTDAMKVIIAGTGCQMLLGRDHDLFQRVASILVYPSTVMLPARPVGVFSFPREPVSDTAVLGVATQIGTVILAWDAVRTGAADARNGHNVVIHELAHQIDLLDGTADGTPPMASPALRRWGQAFEAAFVAHQSRAAHHQQSPLRDYAVTNEAEYFAVASEAFFERPTALATDLPDVYAALRDYYGLDPATRRRPDR